MKRQVESSSPNMDMKRQVETSSPNMDIKKVLKSHEALLFQNKEDPNLVERTEKIPFAHTVGADGMIFPAHNYHGGKWVDRIGSCDQFAARSDDLFICCVMRSGSNWAQNMIKHILGMPIETITINLVRWFEGHNNAQLDQIQSPRIFKSHLHYSKLPKDAKTIYIARNPFDNCVANYEIVKGYCTFGAEDLSWEKYLDLYLEGSVLFGSWFEHVKQGWNKANSGNNSNILFIRYEDMKTDETGTVQKIADFLEVPISEDRAKEIAELTTFNKMKKDPTANFQWTKMLCNDGFDFIRKGVVGDYLNYFTEEQMERVRAKLREISNAGVSCFDEYLG
ncbi:hypothetical protein ACHWQZ_G017478 [Mnemiopsis leidyi]